MREVPLYPYILFGSSMRFLQDVNETTPLRQKMKRGELSLHEHMEDIRYQLLVMRLPVTLHAFEGELEGIREAIKKSAPERRLSEQQVEDFLERVKIVADVLKYEAMNLQAFLVSEKRLPTEKLLSNIGLLFGQSVYAVLPDLCQYDFTQAGRCIAFELPTAAAFHILRATEGVLRSYYSALLPDSNRSQPLLWGPMVTELRRLDSNVPAKELLDNLDNIRVSFRNPTQHPEKRYDIDEAQDLFNLCVDAVNRMAKDLIKRGIWEEEIPF